MGGEAPPTFWDRLFTQVLSVLPGAVPPDSRMSPSPNSRIYLSRYITDWLTSLIHCVRYYIHNTWYITQYITHWHYSHHPHYAFTLFTHYIKLITVTYMEAPVRLEYTVSCGSFFWQSKKKHPNLPDISLWNADISTSTKLLIWTQNSNAEVWTTYMMFSPVFCFI